MISFIGNCIQNLIKTLKYIIKGNLNWNNTLYQSAVIGFDSLGIALMIVFIAASVIALQVSNQFLLTGAESYIGGFLAVALIREIAPGFAALAIGARAGTAITAEIANMQVTEQVDAMEVLGVDSIGYYFAPRLIASTVMVALIVILAETLGILAGMIISYGTIGLHPNRYLSSVWLMLTMKDLFVSIFKGAIFGGIIAIVCATVGYNTKGGAKGVGESTTKSAILCTLFLLIADLLIGFLFYMAGNY